MKDKWKEQRLKDRRCIDCGKVHSTGCVRCQECLDKQAEYKRRYRNDSTTQK